MFLVRRRGDSKLNTDVQSIGEILGSEFCRELITNLSYIVAINLTTKMEKIKIKTIIGKGKKNCN